MAETVNDILERLAAQGVLELLEAAGVGHKNRHGHIAPLVGQLDGLVAVAAVVAQARLLTHHRHIALAAVEEVEGTVCRGALVEGLLSGGLEVDGVGQHQAGEGSYGPVGNDVPYPFLRFVGDPVVDADPGVLRVALKVHRPHLNQ